MALLGSGCARCGRPYPAQGIKVLAQRDEIAFVQLICFGCQVQTLALVTGVEALTETAGEDGEGGTAAAPAAGGNGTARHAAAVTEDDVLEMHTFLSAYEGDIRHLLDGGARGGGSGRGGEGPAG